MADGEESTGTGLYKGLTFLSLGCGLPGMLIGLLAAVVFAAILIGSSGTDNAGASNPSGDTTISSRIPPGWAEILSFAAGKTSVPAALIGGIFLTEIHSDSFGADVSPTDTQNCTANGSGARGPMQIISSTWAGYKDDMKAAGAPPEVYNSSVAPCDYRWGFVAGGFVIKGKASGIDLTTITENKVRTIAGAYCGNHCNYDSACDTSGYIYCDQAWRHYQIVSGASTVSYLPPPIALAINPRVCGKGLL